MPPKKKPTSRQMRCFTCHEVVTLTIDDTKYVQYDEFAAEHAHNPDWKRWTHLRDTFPNYPEKETL